MEDAFIQVAIQVPSIVVLGYVFLKVLTMIMNMVGAQQKERDEKIVTALENVVSSMRDVVRDAKERERRESA